MLISVFRHRPAPPTLPTRCRLRWPPLPTRFRQGDRPRPALPTLPTSGLTIRPPIGRLIRHQSDRSDRQSEAVSKDFRHLPIFRPRVRKTDCIIIINIKCVRDSCTNRAQSVSLPHRKCPATGRFAVSLVVSLGVSLGVSQISPKILQSKSNKWLQKGTQGAS